MGGLGRWHEPSDARCRTASLLSAPVAGLAPRPGWRPLNKCRMAYWAITQRHPAFHADFGRERFRRRALQALEQGRSRIDVELACSYGGDDLVERGVRGRGCSLSLDGHASTSHRLFLFV